MTRHSHPRAAADFPLATIAAYAFWKKHGPVHARADRAADSVHVGRCVLKTLAEDPPNRIEAALASADAQREAVGERLLEALEHGLGNP